jgi:hypothetical protein
LTKASEDDRQGRYYHKSLEELDKVSLVRDREGFAVLESRSSVAEEEEEEEMAEDFSGPDEQLAEMTEQQDPDRPPKTDRQQAMEAEWGLYRSPALSKNSEEEEDPETDEEHKRDSPDIDEEDFMVCGVSCSGR